MPEACRRCRNLLDPALHALRARSGPTAAQWLWAPASGSPDHVLVAPTHRVLLHPGGGSDPLTLRGAPTTLPLAGKSVGTLVVPLLLPVQEDVDGLFAELRRVLRPHGLLTVLVPTHPSFGLRQRQLRREVRRHWRHRSAVDHPDWLAAAADFAVLADDRLAFAMSVDAGDHAAAVDRLCTSGLYPPALSAPLRARVAEWHAGNPERPVRVALRRLVARR